MTDRDGDTTAYDYDLMKRRVAETTQFGIMTTNALDAMGNALITTRIGTNGTPMVVHQALYDVANRLKVETNALSGVTTVTNNYASGHLVVTNTAPNGTRIETYNNDGTLHSVTGTAVHPVSYDYGVLTVDGTNREYSAEIKLDASGSATAEVKTNFLDMLKRTIKTISGNGGVVKSIYNAQGQLAETIDADCITNLLSDTGKGDMEFSGIDMDGVGAMGTIGTDRVTWTVRDVVSDHSTDVQRTRVFTWRTGGSGSDVCITTNETSADGLRTWNYAYGLSNLTQTVYSGTNRYVTNILADGSYTLSQYQYGRLASSATYPPTGSALLSSMYGYDAYGRQNLPDGCAERDLEQQFQ